MLHRKKMINLMTRKNTFIFISLIIKLIVTFTYAFLLKKSCLLAAWHNNEFSTELFYKGLVISGYGFFSNTLVLLTIAPFIIMFWQLKNLKYYVRILIALAISLVLIIIELGFYKSYFSWQAVDMLNTN
jgi:hypothetical protein